MMMMITKWGKRRRRKKRRRPSNQLLSPKEVIIKEKKIFFLWPDNELKKKFILWLCYNPINEIEIFKLMNIKSQRPDFFLLETNFLVYYYWCRSKMDEQRNCCKIHQRQLKEEREALPLVCAPVLRSTC